MQATCLTALSFCPSFCALIHRIYVSWLDSNITVNLQFNNLLGDFKYRVFTAFLLRKKKQIKHAACSIAVFTIFLVINLEKNMILKSTTDTTVRYFVQLIRFHFTFNEPIRIKVYEKGIYFTITWESNNYIFKLNTMFYNCQFILSTRWHFSWIAWVSIDLNVKNIVWRIYLRPYDSFFNHLVWTVAQDKLNIAGWCLTEWRFEVLYKKNKVERHSNTLGNSWKLSIYLSPHFIYFKSRRHVLVMTVSCIALLFWFQFLKKN